MVRCSTGDNYTEERKGAWNAMESFTNHKNIGHEVIMETTRSNLVTADKNEVKDKVEIKDNLFGTEEGENLRRWCIGFEA